MPAAGVGETGSQYGEDGADHLGDHVWNHIARLKSTAGPQPDCYRAVEVPTGDVPDRISHGQHGQPEGETDPEESDTQRCADETGEESELGYVEGQIDEIVAISLVLLDVGRFNLTTQQSGGQSALVRAQLVEARLLPIRERAVKLL